MVRVRAFALAVLVAASLFGGGCAPLFHKPTVSFERVDLVEVSFEGIRANLLFRVENHNTIGVNLVKLLYQLTVDNHRFVEGAANSPLQVPANGVGEMTLPVSFKFTELAEALASILSKRQVPYTLAAQLGFGTPLGVLEVPLSHAGTLPVPQLPTLSMANAAVGRIDVSGASLTITVAVRNNNSFTLPVGPLRYALSINGASILSAATAPAELAPGGTLPLTLSAHLDFVRVGLALVRAIQSRAATVALDGSFDLRGYSMPVHLSHALR